LLHFYPVIKHSSLTTPRLPCVPLPASVLILSILVLFPSALFESLTFLAAFFGLKAHPFFLNFPVVDKRHTLDHKFRMIVLCFVVIRRIHARRNRSLIDIDGQQANITSAIVLPLVILKNGVHLITLGDIVDAPSRTHHVSAQHLKNYILSAAVLLHLFP